MFQFPVFPRNRFALGPSSRAPLNNIKHGFLWWSSGLLSERISASRIEELPCIGDRPAWSWMNSGGAPRDLSFSKFPAEDVILHLALLEQEGTAHPLLKAAADKDLQLMLQQMFIDTHNTGF